MTIPVYSGLSKQAKTYVIIAIIILVLVIGVALFYYKKGKKQVTVAAPPGDLPGGGSSSGSNGNNPAGASEGEIKMLAQQLYADMDGYNWNGHDETIYQRVAALSDTDLVVLYDVFNTLYQQQSGETLRQWMENEKYWDSELTDTIISRLAKYNLP